MNEPLLDDDYLLNEDSVDNAEFAGFWIRVGASLIDALVLLPIIGLTFYNLLILKSIPLMLFLTLLSFLYKPLLEWKKSATFGKMAVGIKLVDSAMNNITLEQAVKRYFPWVISTFLATLVNLSLYNMPEFQEVNDFMSTSLLTNQSPYYIYSNLFNVVFIVIVASLIFDSHKQGLHDKYAKTYCIKTR